MKVVNIEDIDVDKPLDTVAGSSSRPVAPDKKAVFQFASPKYSEMNVDCYGKDAAAGTSEIEVVETDEVDKVPLDMLLDFPTSPVDDRAALDKNERFPSDEFTGVNLDSGGTPPGTSENAPKPRRNKFNVMEDMVEIESYCETVYDPETLESLLHFGEHDIQKFLRGYVFPE